MPPLRLQAFTVGGERVENLARLGSLDAGEHGRIGPEHASGGAFGRREFGGCGVFCRSWSRGERNGERLQIAQRSGALGQLEDCRDGLHAVQTVDLEARQVEHWHAREGVHHGAIAAKEGAGGVVADALPDAGLLPRQQKAGGHSLDIPLEGAADGLVEIVEVEYEATVGSCEGTEVADVGVTAELRVNAGVGTEREITGHYGDGATEEAEGRAGHPLVFDGDERGNTAAHRLGHQGERAGVAALSRGGVPAGVVGAAHVLAVRLTEGKTFAGWKRSGHGWSGYTPRPMVGGGMRYSISFRCNQLLKNTLPKYKITNGLHAKITKQMTCEAGADSLDRGWYCRAARVPPPFKSSLFGNSYGWL